MVKNWSLKDGIKSSILERWNSELNHCKMKFKAQSWKVKFKIQSLKDLIKSLIIVCFNSMFGLWKMEFKAWSLKDGIQSLVFERWNSKLDTVCKRWNSKFNYCRLEFKVCSLQDGIQSSIFERWNSKFKSFSKVCLQIRVSLGITPINEKIKKISYHCSF